MVPYTCFDCFSPRIQNDLPKEIKNGKRNQRLREIEYIQNLGRQMKMR
jgi:hypothetical protein